MAKLRDVGRTVVLVVEDEPMLRLHATDMIEGAGFEPVEAANADEAIRILEARSDIGIVFTDIQMPGSMDGLKLAAAVRDRWPPIDIVVTSAFATPRPGDIPERGVFFSKPYDDAQVVSALRSFAA